MLEAAVRLGVSSCGTQQPYGNWPGLHDTFDAFKKVEEDLDFAAMIFRHRSRRVVLATAATL